MFEGAVESGGEAACDAVRGGIGRDVVSRSMGGKWARKDEVEANDLRGGKRVAKRKLRKTINYAISRARMGSR